MISDVKVYIKATAAIGRISDTFPLILESMAEDGAEDVSSYIEYSSLAAVANDYEEDTEVYKTAELLFSQSDAPCKVAVCSTGLKAGTAIGMLEAKGWRQLIAINTDPSDTTASGIASLIERAGCKTYFMTAKDTEQIADVAGKERTMCLYLPGDAGEYNHPEAAIVGATAGMDAGSFTYKNIIIKGLDPVEMTEQEVEELHKSGAITLLRKAGDIVTSEGISTSGEYMDILDAKDYVITNIEYSVQKLLNVSSKIPYTDTGISQIENAVYDVLKSAYNKRIIADDEKGSPDFSTNFPGRADVADIDRQERQYKVGTFRFGLAGAIHNLEINGELVI